MWWLPVGTAVLIPRAARSGRAHKVVHPAGGSTLCALPDRAGAVPIRTTAPTSKERTMACTDPQCDSGIIPNPYSDDPEDLTLCPGCNDGYDPRDYAS